MKILISKKSGALLAALAVMGGFGFAQPAQARGGDYCREYTESIRISGKWEDGYGTVCLQEDGSWKIAVGATPERRYDRRNYAYRERDYDRRYYAPVRTTVYEHRRPRVIYVYERPHYFFPPGHARHYDRHHRKHYHGHYQGHRHDFDNRRDDRGDHRGKGRH